MKYYDLNYCFGVDCPQFILHSNFLFEREKNFNFFLFIYLFFFLNSTLCKIVHY